MDGLLRLERRDSLALQSLFRDVIHKFSPKRFKPTFQGVRLLLYSAWLGLRAQKQSHQCRGSGPRVVQ